MRVLSLSTLVVALSLLLVGGAHAQGKGKDKDKDKDKKHDWPTEIGGKKAEEWIKEIKQRDRAKSLQALKTVTEFGPKKAYEAVPIILGELKKHKPASGLYVDTSFLANAPTILVSILHSQEKVDPKQVIEVVNVFKNLLKDRQVVVKYRTLVAISNLGPYMKAAAHEIAAMVRDLDTWEIRQLAATMLGSYPFDRKKETPPLEVSEALLKRLKYEPSSQVKMAILHSIDRLDLTDLNATKKAVDQYINEILYTKAYEEKDLSVRINAHLVAYGIDKTRNKDRREALANYATKSKDHAVRIEALHALAKLGPEARDKIKLVYVECLDPKKVDDVNIRVAALHALTRMGGKTIAPTVASFLKDEDVPMRVAALANLASLGADAKGELSQMIGLLKDKDLAVRVATLEALATLGKDAAEVANPVLRLVEDPKEKQQVRAAAIQALGRIGAAPQHMDALVKCLKDNDTNVVAAAVMALASMENRARPALPQLRVVSLDMGNPEALRRMAEEAIKIILTEKKSTNKKGGAK